MNNDMKKNTALYRGRCVSKKDSKFGGGIPG